MNPTPAQPATQNIESSEKFAVEPAVEPAIKSEVDERELEVEPKAERAAAPTKTTKEAQPVGLTDWNTRFMPVTLQHYEQQLRPPRHAAEPQRRLTLAIPDRLHRDIKVYCAQHDLQIGTLISAILLTCFKGQPGSQQPSLIALMDHSVEQNPSLSRSKNPSQHAA